MNTKKTFQAVDLMKFILAIGIVEIHTRGLQDVFGEIEYWYLERLLTRLGVPFFFVASGFFIGKKIYDNPIEVKQIVINYIKRLAAPLVVFQIINIIIRFILNSLNGQSPMSLILLTVRSILFYPYGALWYMQASIVAIVLLYYFIRSNKMFLAISLGAILYLVGLLANSYYFIIEGTALANIVDLYLKIFVSARNGLFVGFLFLGIGIWLSEHFYSTPPKRFKNYSLMILMVSVIFSIIEISKLYGQNFADSGDYYIMLIFLVPSLFSYLLTVNLNMSDTLSKTVRSLSTGLYLLHAPARDMTQIIANLNNTNISYLKLFMITLIVCFIILWGVYYSKPKTIYKLLS